MQNSQNKKALQIVLLVVIAVVTLGIGYAAISAVNLIINGNARASVDQNNFIVHFIEAKNITGTTGVGGTSIIDSDDTKASFNVTGLTKIGDYAEAVYTVRNDSNGIGAEILLKLINSNNEYFKVTETVADSQLQAGDTTTVTVKIEMIKTPILDEETTNITAILVSKPIENTFATGSDISEISRPNSQFDADSWNTIKNNIQNGNIDQYEIGDTKNVYMGKYGYHSVRIANKSFPDECNNEEYSKTACGFVLEFEDIIVDDISNNGIEGYTSSTVYNYIKDDIYNEIPDDLKNIIIDTKVLSAYNKSYLEGCCFLKYTKEVLESNDKLYLLSGKEVFGDSVINYRDNTKELTRQLDYYSNKVVYDYTKYSTKYFRGVSKTYNYNYKRWWLRSYFQDYAQKSNYWYESVSGGKSSSLTTGVPWYNSSGISPAFRIG